VQEFFLGEAFASDVQERVAGRMQGNLPGQFTRSVKLLAAGTDGPPDPGTSKGATL
jgi:hypothetical protein